MRHYLSRVWTRRHLGVIAATGLLLATLLAVRGVPSAAQGVGDWPAYLDGPTHSSYNAGATAITPANAAMLSQSWKWTPPAAPKGGTNRLLASPTVADGVVYIGADDGDFYAVNETTGAVIWSLYLGVDKRPKGGKCGSVAQGIIATATVADDPVSGAPTVFVNSGDGHLYALDATSGAVVWKALVDTPSTTVQSYYSWGSPLVTNGDVYVGISSNCDTPLVQGGLVSFNQSTGAQVAKWQDTPTGKDGGSIWSSPALLSNGDIVVTTGNGYATSGEPLYNESIVSLDPNSLTPVDSWQVPVAQRTDDSDFGASPTVWTATINNVSTPMVGACNKNGIFYAFAQGDLNAGPVWQTRITVPYKGGATECDSAAIWDGSQLIIGGGDATTINQVNYPGSVQALDPATGAPTWQTGLSGMIVATPTEDGGGVVAAPTWQSTYNDLGVYLMNATTGAIIGFIRTNAAVFGQPVFADNYLFVDSGSGYGLQAFAPPAGGTPMTSPAR